MEKELKAIRNQISFYLMNNLKEIKEVEIDSIPDNWETFPGTKDEWIKLQDKNDTLKMTTCVYRAKEGSIFDTHKHPYNTEIITIINPKGKIKVNTPTRAFEMVYPNSCAFEKNEPHIVKFLTDTDILCIWKPKFKKGWNADFKIKTNDSI